MIHIKGRAQDTLALNTVRQIYDAKELYFSEEGAGKQYVTVATLVKTGYASASLDAATMHDVGTWHTSGLRTIWMKPGAAVKIQEQSRHGNRMDYGRVLLYPNE